MSISVVDLNEEAKEEAPAIEPIEEEEEAKETVVDVVNEVVEEVNEPPKEQEVKEQPKITNTKGQNKLSSLFLKKCQSKVLSIHTNKNAKANYLRNQSNHTQNPKQNKLPNPNQLLNRHQKYITAMMKKKCHNNH